jgi:hypothetical protein
MFRNEHSSPQKFGGQGQGSVYFERSFWRIFTCWWLLLAVAFGPGQF